MKNFALLAAAMLLAGCAAIGAHRLPEELPPISGSSWEQVQSTLHDAPLKLRQSITHSGKARLPGSSQTAAQDPPVSGNVRSLLIDILTHTQDRALLPDAEFERASSIVAGEDQPLRRLYAATLADYLLQPDFSCRQPVYARYFQNRYSDNKPVEQCGAKVPFSVLSRYDGAQIVWLDPKRIKSIHLLFASSSPSLASRFGHVALRLVVCPEGKTTETECDENLFEHLVLGFQAHIDEFSLKTLKALGGSYKAYLFANRFLDVYEEYAIGEFRDVYSLPLRLEGAQRAAMVRELADIHWQYAGKYNFFSRNCATMMQNALRTVWPELSSNEIMKSDFLRPDSLFKAVKSIPLADSEKLASLDAAERNGYFFSSTRQFYDRALNLVKDKMTAPAFVDLEGYLQIHPIKRRLARSLDKQFSTRLLENRYLHEAQILLEEYAVLRSERMLMAEFSGYLEEQDFTAREKGIRTRLDAEHFKIFDECLLTPIKEHVSPIKRLTGIPGASDIPAQSAHASICKSAQSRILLHESIEMLNDTKSESWQSLNETSLFLTESIENVLLLRKP